MSRPVRHNVTPAADPRHATHFLWEEFDRLPRLIRDLMNYTPHPVGTGFVYRQILDGSPIEAVARAAIRRWRGYARAQTLALYGPTHPSVSEPDAA